MNTTKLAEIGEVISSIAIVFTLIILIFEVKDNTAEIRANTTSDIAGRTQEFTIAHITNPEVELVWNKLRSGEDLSDSELGLASSLRVATMKIAEESYLAYRDGRLDEEVWLTRAWLATSTFTSQQIRAEWISGMPHEGWVQGFDEWLYTELTEEYGEDQ